MTVGEKIIRLRKNQKMTQQDLVMENLIITAEVLKVIAEQCA